MEKLDQTIARIKDELVGIRKEFHRFPEVGFQEHRTAATVTEYLKKLGLEVAAGIGGTGVIGVLRGENEGPTIAFRVCLDALAMDERSGVEYA